MFRSYPLEAASDNWIHEFIVEAVRSVHEAVDRDDGMDWPVLVAAHERLQSRSAIRENLLAYEAALRLIDEGAREALLRSVVEQNLISELLSGASDCAAVGSLATEAAAALALVFESGFALLHDLRIRHSQYTAVYSADFRECPFCGFERLSSPVSLQEDLDHYLARRLYPFAASNLRNLVPMGGKCNQRYKGGADLLWGPDGARRVAFDPYQGTERVIRLTLCGSLSAKPANDGFPDWKLGFDPQLDECDTWDQVFSVRARVRHDMLDGYYPRWLGNFGRYCSITQSGPPEDERLAEVLDGYCQSLSIVARGELLDILEFEVFRLIRQWWTGGDAAVGSLLCDAWANAV